MNCPGLRTPQFRTCTSARESEQRAIPGLIILLHFAVVRIVIVSHPFLDLRVALPAAGEQTDRLTHVM